MDPANMAVLDSFLTPARIAPYMAACSGNAAKARRLYVWNIELTSAFWGPVAALEIALRNAVHHQFATHFGSQTWWNDPALTVDAAKAQAKERELQLQHARGARGPVTPDDVVAALTFGFWSTLIGSPKGALEQNTYWHMFLYKAFPNWNHLPNNSASRKAFVRRIELLRKFRNRLAHHEPIHGRNLADDQRRILEMARLISTDLEHFLNGNSRIPATIARRSHALDHGHCRF